MILPWSNACNERDIKVALYSVKCVYLNVIPPKETNPHFLGNGTPKENPHHEETSPLCTFYTDLHLKQFYNRSNKNHCSIYTPVICKALWEN